MFGKLLNMGSRNRISSIDDLVDSRARGIADRYKLDVKEILPLYLELAKEVSTNGGKIEIDTEDPQTPVNVHEGYKRKVASGAVISYELTKINSVQFPIAEKPVLLHVGEEAILAAIQLKGNLVRAASIEVYEQLGSYYEQVLTLLEKHQTYSTSRIIDVK